MVYTFRHLGEHTQMPWNECKPMDERLRLIARLRRLVGIRELDDQLWHVSFLEYDLGHFDRDHDRVEPGPNPFAPDTVLTMCPE